MKCFKITVSALIMLSSYSLNSQSSTATNNGVGPQNSFARYLGFITNHDLGLRTNGFNRMIIQGGAGGPNAGRISIGNNLPNNFVPQSRVHIHQTSAFQAQNDTYIRFTNIFTGASNTSGFAIGNSNAINGPQGDVQMQQYEAAPISMLAPNAHSVQTLPYEWFRLQNGAVFSPNPLFIPNKSTDGYIGLNKSDPRSHIEMITPAHNGGEEFFMAKPDDIYATPNTPSSGLAPNVQMGMMNLSSLPNRFLPGFFGNINQSAQLGPALQLLGCIPGNHDIVNREPIMRFVVGRDWEINGTIPNPVGTLPTQTVINRPIFSWQNVDLIYMYMGANGRARIGYNISTGILPNIPENRANNRWEITADAIDPYYNAVGSPSPNPNWSGATIGGASGLRFTFLRSYDFVQVPSATNGIDPAKVLTTDKNGDVVMINTIASANNGLSVSNGTMVQLGTNCPATLNEVLNSQLLNNRQIIMNGFNTVWAGNTGSVGIGLPINSCAPNNRLEVNNNTGPNFLSGLRLTDLAAATPTSANGQVLSVNAAGDVILTNAPAGGPGGYCTPTSVPSPLIANYEIPLNQNNYYFSGSQLNGDRVAVGYNCGTALPSKFNVELNQTYNTSFNIGNNAGYFRNINTGTAHNVGVKGEVTSGAGDNSGGFFVANSTGINSSNNGVYSRAAGSPNTNRGGFFQGIGGNDAVGITATAFGGLNTSYAAVFNGNILINGDINGSGSNNYVSDVNYKNNIDSSFNAKYIISNLKPRSFYFDTLNSSGIKFSSKKQYGLIAQHVETLLPELVGSVTKPAEKDSLGNIIIPSTTYKNLNYNAFIGILIKGMQEQQKTIDSLKGKLNSQDSINTSFQNQINTILSTLNSCCSNSNARSTGVQGNDPKALNQLNVNLSDVDMIVLNQNVPNPFAEQTTITYNVPEKYGFAQLIFKMVDGKIIKTVDITKKGRGQVNVYANDLSNGLYMYSLIVDGMTIDTKKMVKQ